MHSTWSSPDRSKISKIPWHHHFKQYVTEQPYRKHRNKSKQEAWFTEHERQSGGQQHKGRSLQSHCPSNISIVVNSVGPILPESRKHNKKNMYRDRLHAGWLEDFTTRHRSEVLLYNLGWGDLNQWRVDSRLCMAYNIVYGLVAIPVFFSNDGVHLQQIYTKPNCYLYSFFPDTVSDWNQLPGDNLSAKSLAIFEDWVATFQHAMSY